VPSGFEDRCELRISGFSATENYWFPECVISSDVMVCDISRFSDFVTSCDFVAFEIFRFSDFFGHAGLRDFSML
jgi:hypothetical protein